MLYSYADKAVSLITAAEDKLNRMRTLQSGGLMIGASDTLCQFFLLPYLEKFHTEYPEVQLQVTNRTTPDTVELLKVGKVDIALVNLPVDDSAFACGMCYRSTMCSWPRSALRTLKAARSPWPSFLGNLWCY